jgi:hypothetical protein
VTTATKISVSWDELHSTDVEQKIERQQAITKVRDHYREAVPLNPGAQGGVMYHAAVYMALFGLLGGLLAFGVSELFGAVFPDHLQDIRTITAQEQSIVSLRETGMITDTQKQIMLNDLYAAYPDNDYVSAITDWLTDGATKQQLLMRRWEQYKMIHTVRQVIWHSIVGVFLAVALAIGDHVMGRNWRNVMINGSVAVLLGIAGGVLVSLFDNRIYAALGGDAAGVTFTRQMIARTVGWGILGLFLSIAPGIVLKSPKRLVIGLVGGFVGGVLGGMLFDPISVVVESGWMSRLIAIAAIGVIAGLGTGLIETVAKTGWLKIEQGLIAGKQFILYRNPTYIGASPQCEIYLFNDPQIGPQHAAIHLLGGGFEIEDLNDASQTKVNGKPITRARLRHGDRVAIGGTTIVFKEKRQAPRFRY